MSFDATRDAYDRYMGRYSDQLAITGAILSLVLISSQHSRDHRDAAQAGELQPIAV